MRKVALREVVSVVGGGTPRKSSAEFYGGSIPWVTPKDMKREVITSSLVKLTQQGVQNSPAKLVPRDTVLVVVRSGVLKHTLPVAVTGVPVTLNQDMKGLVPGEIVHGPYLARLVKALEPIVLGWVRATTADNFPIDKLLDFEVTLPSLDEQRRIAAILDCASELRIKHRQVYRLLEELRQASFAELVGDPISSGSDGSLRDVAEIQIGPFGSLLHKDDYVMGGIPVINPMHIVDGAIKPVPSFSVPAPKAQALANYRLQPGDVIMGRRGEMGRCAVVGERHKGFLCGTGSLIVRPISAKSNATFLQAALSHARTKSLLERAARGSTLPNLNASIVNKLPIRIPPIATQERFADLIGGINTQVERSAGACDRFDELFASLQSRAFSGQL